MSRPLGIAVRAVGALVWAVSTILVAVADPAPEPSPLRIAEGHLRRANEHLTASCEMLKQGKRHAVDGYYLACEEAWNAVWTCPESPELLREAGEAYADGLAGLLEAARLHGRMDRGGLWIGPKGRPILVPYRPQALPVDVGAIASIEPQGQPGDRRLARRHAREGFGLPVVVRVATPPRTEGLDPRAAARADGTAAGDAPATRQSLAATAVLRFAIPGDENFLEKFAGPVSRDHAPAVLDLANPVEIAAVHIGPARPHLAADLTAPLLDMLEAKPRSAVAGFIQPFGRGDTRPHLEILEPHQPGRIPVVFVHGLASDEGTWFDMLNELRAWPLFHRKFEPWVFHYPTGASFLQSSQVLRRELASRVRELDPDGRDPALKNLVVVGHSMGGLHAKLLVCEPGTALWDATAKVPFSQVRLQPQLKRFIAPNYFYKPLPFVNRVVCIATPHRGSALASLGVGRLASLTVRTPPEAAAVHAQAVRLNPDAFQPEFERRVPTTIDLLEPDSGMLAAIERLRPPCWVTLHSVVGVAHHSLRGGRDDYVVHEDSAHTVGAVSEIRVPASHTKVHHHPQTIAEIRRILVQHLQETGL